MRRLTGLGVAGLLALAVLLVPALPAAAVGTAESPATSFAGCIAGGGSADVLLLIDESSSLRTTDPAGARVTSAQYFADRLREFAVRAKRPVDVAVAGFGDRYDRVGGWTALSASTTPRIDASLASFRSRTAGFDTDYWTALHRAQSDLAARAAQTGGQRCQAVVWFTDGRLDYFPRTTGQERSRYGTRKVFAPDVDLTTSAAAARVRRDAQQDLCRDGGVADQLRSSGISIFAVGLDGAAGSSGQFDLLRSIATGSTASTGGTACGALGGHPPGSFTRASNIEGLLLAFDEIGTPDSTPITQEAGICQRAGGVCADGAHRFVLDASISQVQALATATVPGLQVRLLTPAGALVKVPAGGDGTLRAAGVRIGYSWVTGKAVTIDLDEASAAGDAWTGVWQLAFVDGSASSSSGRSRTSIHLLSPVAPGVQGTLPALHRGAAVAVRLGLDGPDGTIDATGLLGDLDYSAVLVDSTGARHPVLSTTDKAEVAGRHRLDLDGVAVGAAVLDLTARITTAAAVGPDGDRVPGTALAAKQVSVPVQVLPPTSYPAVASTADFGAVTGASDAATTLSTTGAGCVWLPDGGAVRVQGGPADVSGFRVASGSAVSRASCARVGATDRLPLELTASGAGNGVLNGTVQVLTAPADGTGEPVAATVAVTARYEKPLNTTNFLIVLIAALLLGPGVPLLLFLLMKAAVSRIPPRPLAATLIPVRIGEGAVQRDGRRFTVQAADFRGTVPIGPHGERRVLAAGVDLSVRLGLSPFGLGRVLVDAPGRLALSDTDGLRVRRDGATLPLAVHDHFVLLRATGSDPSSADLLLLLAGDAGPIEQQRLADRIDRDLPAMQDALLAEERGSGGGIPPRPDLAPAGAPSSSSPSSSASDGEWSF